VEKKKSAGPKLPKISEQMKAWSAALAAEVNDWPQVSSRSFFGFTAFYRKDKIFALLPRTRGMETPNSLAFRFDTRTASVRGRLQSDARIRSAEIQKARWFSFELSSDSDLHDALEWLSLAARKSGKSQ
jgi:hypothetical protein